MRSFHFPVARKAFVATAVLIAVALGNDGDALARGGAHGSSGHGSFDRHAPNFDGHRGFDRHHHDADHRHDGRNGDHHFSHRFERHDGRWRMHGRHDGPGEWRSSSGFGVHGHAPDFDGAWHR